MDSTDLPDYVHKLFDKIAQENGFKSFTVNIDSGSQPGDGFTSEIFSVQIVEDQIDDKKLELVCKIAPINETYRKEFLSDTLFKREQIFYEKLMPILSKFQEEKRLSIGDQFQSYPKCYGTIINDTNQRYFIYRARLYFSHQIIHAHLHSFLQVYHCFRRSSTTRIQKIAIS